MKRVFALVVFGVFLCLFFMGCHTVQMLSRIDTGRVGFGDIWNSIVMDDAAFQERYW